MKTFTATRLNKSAQEVFAAAKEDGAVLIEHDRYKGSFAIISDHHTSMTAGTEWIQAEIKYKGDKDGE